jgi:hypothetical protein
MSDRDPSWHFKIADTDEPKQIGYDERKRAKMLRSLEQTKNRDDMVSAEEVWKRLGLEDCVHAQGAKRYRRDLLTDCR